MLEFWAEIEDTYYSISSLGTVKNLKNKFTIEPFEDNYGIYRVSINKDGKSYSYAVHELVGEHFLRKPKNADTLEFIDKDKSHFYLANLKWGVKRHKFDRSLFT